MNAQLKGLLITMVEHPSEDAPGRVLADWLENQATQNQGTIRKNISMRNIYFPGIVLAGNGSDSRCKATLMVG